MNCQLACPPSRLRRRWWPRLVALAAVLVAIPAALVVLDRWDNYHPVVPGRVYRGAQPSGESLARRITQDRIRSVLNLRGPNPGHEWYDREREAAAAHGVAHFDLATGTADVPTGAKLRELIRAIDGCPKPVLIHCQSGIDRTGVASAVCILMEEDGSPEKALDQFGWRYGGTPWRKHRQRQESFVRAYGQWLEVKGLTHTPGRFREWAASTDDPGLGELAQNTSPRRERGWVFPGWRGGL